MVHVVLKGGVWKNSEDEILKAAVQKYGKQQWARVASLLNQKSAKQAKARWHEWLDPSLRKSTEWSPQEQEQLLRLAQLLPAQWKTIGPLLGGRTATQCQEQYEFLLDQAASASAGASGTTANNASSQQQQHQLLRPGQIDSHPESKPAKPDPIDMDEDELEMLQEARARLANTQGKKAKRKQRERMLQQAKRLADLQKRRELKQAGLLLSNSVQNKKRRRREIDLAVEIPFYKPAPAGFFDTQTEAARSEALRQKRMQAVDFHQVNENQLRTRDRDAAAARKREERRMKMLQQSTDQYATAATKQPEAEELPATFRTPLLLPEPMEWAPEEDGKPHAIGTGRGGGGHGATATLVADLSQRPLPTPMRQQYNGTATTTITTADLAARQLRHLERGSTPLLLSAMTTTGDDDNDDNDYEPDAQEYLLHQQQQSNDNNHTHHDNDTHSVSTFQTAATSLRERARQEKRATKRARAALAAALAALPASQYEYELAAPSTTTTDGVMEEPETIVSEEDQAEVEARALLEEQHQAAERFQARSSVMQRTDLPRPKVPHMAPLDPESIAATFMAREAQLWLQQDALAFPLPMQKGKNRKRKQQQQQRLAELTDETTTAAAWEILPKEALASAKTLLQSEYEHVLEEKLDLVLRDGKAPDRDSAMAFLVQENVHVSQAGAADLHPDGAGGWSQSGDVKASLQHQFHVLQQATLALQTKNDKLAHKLTILQGGYVQRAAQIQSATTQTRDALAQARCDALGYATLQRLERVGGPERLERLQREVQQLRADEAVLQKQYGALVVAQRRRRQQQQTSQPLAL